MEEQDAVSIQAEEDDFELEEKRNKLEEDLRKTQANAYSAGTVKNFLCQWRSFIRFTKSYRYTTWPVTAHILALYAQFLAYTFHSARSVRNYLSGVRTLHVLMNLQPPSLSNTEIKLTLMGLTKMMKRPIKQAQPLTPETMLEMFTFIDLELNKDLIMWAMIVVGFFAMLRKSNLMPDSKTSFCQTKQLTRGQITFEDGVAMISVKWSKTLQFKNKVLKIPLFPIPGSPLCPVTVLKALLAKPGRSSDPLFKIGKSKLITYPVFQKRLKDLAVKAGYKRSAFTSHSLRRGGASWAFKSGVNENLIKILGDWSSDSYRRYLEFPIEMRALVNLKMRERILNRVL